MAAPPSGSSTWTRTRPSRASTASAGFRRCSCSRAANWSTPWSARPTRGGSRRSSKSTSSRSRRHSSRNARGRDRMATIRDVVIIGSGPAGLTAALYTARANLKPLVIEGLEAGGQLMMTTLVENWPGHKDGVMGPELMAEIRAQAERFGAEIVRGHVTDVDVSRHPFTITTSDGSYTSRTLIVATGASARLLGLPSERALMGRGVSTCATCDGYFFRGKPIAVVGG